MNYIHMSQSLFKINAIYTYKSGENLFFFFFYLVLERKSFSLLQTMVSESFGAFNLGGFYGFNGLI